MKQRSRPAKTAIALHYDSSVNDSAPQVIAKGSGELAEEIIRLAKESGIPLQENAAMVALLSKLDLGEDIPAELYLAVAEILAFAYALRGKVPAA